MSFSRWEHEFEWMSTFCFYNREVPALSQDSVDKREEGVCWRIKRVGNILRYSYRTSFVFVNHSILNF